MDRHPTLIFYIYLDMNEHISFSNRFSEKICFLGKWPILDAKMTYPHNIESALRKFLKFFTMKGTKKDMEIVLPVFLKIFSFGANGPF